MQIRSSLLQELQTYQKVEVGSGTQVFQAVNKLVQGTWNKDVVGLGNDAQGLTHKTISVQKVWRIEAPSLFHKYRRRLQEICLEASVNSIPLVKDLEGKKQIMTTELSKY